MPPLPTKETLPLMAEAMGAASYEETIEDGDEPFESGSTTPAKRVQRKLHNQPVDDDLNSEAEYAEYQGVMGRPGVDFPVLPSIPRTEFSCRKVKNSGYYADLETGCQVFHICDGGRKISFLCPNGTIFRQSHLICDWWFRVDCERSEELYEESAEQLAHDQMVYKKRAEALAKTMQPQGSRAEPSFHEPQTYKPQERKTSNFRKDQPVNSRTQSPVQNNFRNQGRTEADRGNNRYVDNQSQRRRQRPNTVAPEQAKFVSNRQEVDQRYQERERQVPAETASFASNRHRFSNQLDQENIKAQYQTYTTSTQKYPVEIYSENFVSSTYKPIRFTPEQTTPKPIFTVRVKPEKSFSYLELHRESFSTAKPSSFQTSASNNAYLPNSTPSSRDNFKEYSSTKSDSLNYPTTSGQAFTRGRGSGRFYNPDSKFATFNQSGVSEAIRPESVNSLVDSRVGSPAKALHSLVSYYGTTALESSRSPSSTQKPVVPDTRTGPSTSSGPTAGDNLPSVLTKATKDSYSMLFSEETDKNKPSPSPTEDVSSAEVETSSEEKKEKDLNLQQSQGIVQSSDDSKIEVQDMANELRLKNSADLRELAQVFSRALSAYLEDPETFKEILAQVRPTEPNPTEGSTPSPDDEVLDFSDASGQGKSVTSQAPVPSTQATGVSIGDINNLVTPGKSLEPDNSIEHVTVPGGPVASSEDLAFTTASPPAAYEVNSIAQHNKTGNDYYAQLGSNEDPSYFPTAGSVSDSSRPRYGGFQNNTMKRPNYSPYGAGLPSNITGAPLTYSTTKETPTAEALNQKNTAESVVPPSHQLQVPEAYDVNSLVTHNDLYSPSGNGQFSVSSEERFDTSQPEEPSLLQKEQDYYSSPDQEKLLIASGSQSIVSNDNYVQFVNRKNYKDKSNEKNKPPLYNFNSFVNYATSVADFNGTENNSTDAPQILSQVFEQVPPEETFEIPTVIYENHANFPHPNHYPIDLRDSEYKVSYQDVNLGNGVTLERESQQTTSEIADSSWTSAPLIQTSMTVSVSTSDPNAPYNHTQFPIVTTQEVIQPTTYHPQHFAEPTPSPLPTVRPPVTTFYSTSVAVDTDLSTDPELYAYPTTNFPVEESNSEENFEEKAKEMFGMLNESAAGTLMEVMNKAESNMTIRRLVLLLVSDRSKENKTAEESRASLIQALLTTDDPSPTPTTQEAETTRFETTTRPPITQQSPRKGKSYRATDSATSVHGAKTTAELNNRINSAKLYIPTNRLAYDSDARAVELLKSLYNLAAKWG